MTSWCRETDTLTITKLGGLISGLYMDSFNKSSTSLISSCICSRTTKIFYHHENNSDIIGSLQLDFKKAFDVINHEVLCTKLSLYGSDDFTLNGSLHISIRTL